MHFEKGKGVFLSGFCPPSIRAVRGFNADSAKRKSVFLGEWIRLASADFPPAGWGEECGRVSELPEFFLNRHNS